MTEHPASVQSARRERLAALDAATRAIAAELDVDRVLQLIVDRVRELVGATYAALGIADARGRMERFITSGITPEARARDRGRARGPRAARPDHPRRAGRSGPRTSPTHPAASASRPTTRRCARSSGVPVAGQGPLGRQPVPHRQGGRRQFNEDDERLVEMFAVHAGIAIENARLHDQVQRLAVVEERERIGKDLHDGIIQAIYARRPVARGGPDLVEDEAGRAEAVARVDRAIDALNLVIADIRSYILRLRPALAGEEDPVEALARLAEELGHARGRRPRGGPRRAAPTAPRRCRRTAGRTSCSSPARPCPTSRATRARRRTTLVLRADGDDLVLRDRGQRARLRSRRARRPGRRGHHQGIVNMRDRAAGMGGSLRRRRPAERGARIIVRVPVARHARHPALAARRPENPPVTDQPSRPLRLLVVDDHEVVRQGLVALLDRREGFQVVAEAGTVAEAIEQARRFQPDIVVMDVRLPDGSGHRGLPRDPRRAARDPRGDAHLVSRRGGRPVARSSPAPRATSSSRSAPGTSSRRSRPSAAASRCSTPR